MSPEQAVFPKLKRQEKENQSAKNHRKIFNFPPKTSPHPAALFPPQSTLHPFGSRLLHPELAPSEPPCLKGAAGADHG
ncbi:MAG: hypothetical protein ACOYLR_01565 [Chlorobium sp.]